jgi:hypothetical protein
MLPHKLTSYTNSFKSNRLMFYIYYRYSCHVPSVNLREAHAQRSSILLLAMPRLLNLPKLPLDLLPSC